MDRKPRLLYQRPPPEEQAAANICQVELLHISRLSAMLVDNCIVCLDGKDREVRPRESVQQTIKIPPIAASSNLPSEPGCT